MRASTFFVYCTFRFRRNKKTHPLPLQLISRPHPHTCFPCRLVCRSFVFHAPLSITTPTHTRHTLSRVASPQCSTHPTRNAPSLLPHTSPPCPAQPNLTAPHIPSIEIVRAPLMLSSLSLLCGGDHILKAIIEAAKQPCCRLLHALVLEHLADQRQHTLLHSDRLQARIALKQHT